MNELQISSVHPSDWRQTSFSSHLLLDLCWGVLSRVNMMYYWKRSWSCNPRWTAEMFICINSVLMCWHVIWTLSENKIQIPQIFTFSSQDFCRFLVFQVKSEAIRSISLRSHVTCRFFLQNVVLSSVLQSTRAISSFQPTQSKLSAHFCRPQTRWNIFVLQHNVSF